MQSCPINNYERISLPSNVGEANRILQQLCQIKKCDRYRLNASYLEINNYLKKLGIKQTPNFFELLPSEVNRDDQIELVYEIQNELKSEWFPKDREVKYHGDITRRNYLLIIFCLQNPQLFFQSFTRYCYRKGFITNLNVFQNSLYSLILFLCKQISFTNNNNNGNGENRNDASNGNSNNGHNANDNGDNGNGENRNAANNGNFNNGYINTNNGIAENNIAANNNYSNNRYNPFENGIGESNNDANNGNSNFDHNELDENNNDNNNYFNNLDDDENEEYYDNLDNGLNDWNF